MAAASGSSQGVPFTNEQLAAFEEVFAQCPHPTASQRQQMKRDYRALEDVEDEKIKAWFQDRRSRDKQEKRQLELDLVKERLIAAHNLLAEENDNLKRMVDDLQHQIDSLRQIRSRMM